MAHPFAPRRALAIAAKELHHIQRDPFTLGLALGLPAILLVFFGYAIDFDIRELPLSVHDRDQTRASRQWTEAFGASGFFRLRTGAGGVLDELDTEKTKAAMIIEPGFGRDVKAGRNPNIQIILDGADNSTAGVIAGYLAGVSKAAWLRIGPPVPDPPVRIRTRFLFNPELTTRKFIVPGLVVIIMGLLATLLTALTVAREWENGSMELLLSTPVRPLEIIAGKLLPYLGLCLAGTGVVYLCARVLFGVPFAGNHLVFLLACLLFLAPTLAQGLLISSATREQQSAFQLSMMSSMLPSMLLSGFIFPVESMPVFFRYATMAFPARWFMIIVRALFLKGTTLEGLAVPLAALAIQGTILIGLTAAKFKTDLEP